MKPRLPLVAVVGVLVAVVTAHAHHSHAVTYDMNKTISVEGKIVQFQFRNPHSFLQIRDNAGVRWAVEWGSSAQLRGQGVTRETWRAGDVITITGNPGRNPSDHRMKMLTVFRASDGYGWGTKPGETYD